MLARRSRSDLAVLGALVYLAGVLPAEGPAAAGLPVVAADQAGAGSTQASLTALPGRAKEAMAAGRYAEAATLYEKMLEAHPNDAELHMHLGMARAMAEQPHAALPALERAVQLDSSLLPAQLVLGTVHLDLGQPQRAVAPLEKVVAAQPENAQAVQALGEALLALERFDEAAQRFEHLTDATPESGRAWAGLVRSYDGEGRRSFGELQKVAPDSPYVSLIVAEALGAIGKLPEAFTLYRKAEAALPAQPGLHDAIADVYEAAGHAEWAARERLRARKATPDCTPTTAACAFLKEDFQRTVQLTKRARTAEAWYWRTRALNQLATRAFAQLERLPRSVELHAVRARLAESQNRPQEAVKELRAALELAPGDPNLERRLARALYLAHDHQAMLPIAEKLLGKAPDEPDLLFLYGSALLETQQVDRAIPQLERAVAAETSLVEARAALGRAFMLKGEAADAIPHLEAALPIDRDGRLYYQLAQAYQRTGRPVQARAALEKYQAIKQRADTATATVGTSAPAITPP